jgi:spermidine synthase
MKLTREKAYALTSFVLGAGVMAVEMTAARLMAPYFGTSFFVWTALIVTILIAMSLGYWFGGRLAERAADEALLGRLLSVAALTVALSVLLLPVIVVPLRNLIAGFGLVPAVLFASSFLAAAIFFGCPVFLLAMAGPTLLKLWGKGVDPGLAAGRYFAVSTVGSVIGTLLPSLVLVPTFGSRITYIAVALTFFACSSLYLDKRSKWLSLTLLVAVLLSGLLGIGSTEAKVLYRGESPYQHIEVWEREGWRYLVFDDVAGIQSALAPGGGLTGEYYDYYGAVPYLRPLSDQSRIAVLGLAGGSAVRGLRNELPDQVNPQIVGVEIDQKVIDVGRRFFGLNELGVEILTMDGRVFLESDERGFDVVLVDAYSNQSYIPPHMVSREFFDNARQRLNREGLLILNVNAAKRDSPLLVTLLNTLTAEFGHVGLVKVPDSWNYLIMASESPIGPETVTGNENAPAWMRAAFEGYSRIEFGGKIKVFTDDWAPLEIMTDMMFISEAWN